MTQYYDKDLVENPFDVQYIIIDAGLCEYSDGQCVTLGDLYRIREQLVYVKVAERKTYNCDSDDEFEHSSNYELALDVLDSF